MVANMDCPAALAARPGKLRLWWTAFLSRPTARSSLADVPEHLRADVGLDGGITLARFENGGRIFITNGHPDSTLSGWHW